MKFRTLFGFLSMSAAEDVNKISVAAIVLVCNHHHGALLFRHCLRLCHRHYACLYRHAVVEGSVIIPYDAERMLALHHGIS